MSSRHPLLFDAGTMMHPSAGFGPVHWNCFAVAARIADDSAGRGKTSAAEHGWSKPIGRRALRMRAAAVLSLHNGAIQFRGNGLHPEVSHS
jgi:hypothetical protein